jgi:hypothetical protein
MMLKILSDKMPLLMVANIGFWSGVLIRYLVNGGHYKFNKPVLFVGCLFFSLLFVSILERIKNAKGKSRSSES